MAAGRNLIVRALIITTTSPRPGLESWLKSLTYVAIEQSFYSYQRTECLERHKRAAKAALLRYLYKNMCSIPLVKVMEETRPSVIVIFFITIFRKLFSVAASTVGAKSLYMICSPDCIL